MGILEEAAAQFPIGSWVQVTYLPAPRWNGTGIVTDNMFGIVGVKFNRKSHRLGGFDPIYVKRVPSGVTFDE